MKTISTQKIFWLTVSALLTIGIVLLSIFSLKNGFYEIYPYFYLIPVILLAYFFPRTSVYFTILLGWVYLALVYLYGPADIRVYASSFAFFYIFVSIGVIISAFSGHLLQERRYREIFETSLAGILTFDLESGQIREVNAKAAEILGFSRQDLATKTFASLMFDEDQIVRFNRAIHGDENIADMELALRKKDREVVWVLVTAALNRENWVVCSLADLTERKRTKDALIESELRYRTLFDGASDAIFLHDLDGRIFETNVIAGRHLGYSKKEYMQMRIHDLDLNPERLFDDEMIREFMAKGHIIYETVQKRKDGTQVRVEVSSRITEYFGMSAVMSAVREISWRKTE